jgi:hypothetical protein
VHRVLIIYWYPTNQRMRASVEHHLRALDGRSDDVIYHNAFLAPPAWLARLSFDGVVLHNTFLGVRWNTDFDDYRHAFAWLADLDAPKVAVPQDEYDHSGVLDDWLSELAVTDVMSDFGPDLRRVLYPSLGQSAKFTEVLTGYIDEQSARSLGRRLVPLADRPLDIVYRASRLPFWFGSHGQLKHRIGETVADRAKAHGLRVDISTRWEDRILGPGWFEFLLSGRVVIGCESGSSVLDRAGEIRRAIEGMLATEPDLSFEQIDGRMPEDWDAWRFYAISPRHLEAVMTRTCQVLVEGEYSGVLKPDRHYIPLARDFSNLDEVLKKIRDIELLEEITSRAYEEIYLSRRWTYSAYASKLEEKFRPAVSHHVLGSLAERLRFAGARTLGRVRNGVARAQAERFPELEIPGVTLTGPSGQWLGRGGPPPRSVELILRAQSAGRRLTNSTRQ